MEKTDRNPDDPTSRIEDIQSYEDVEVVDSNRAVIKTGGSDNSDYNYKMNVTISANGESVNKTIRSSTKTGLFRKFTSWYANTMKDETVLQVLKEM